MMTTHTTTSKTNSVASPSENALWHIEVKQNFGEVSRMAIPPKGMVKIGSSVDNDVVLRNASAAGNQVALHLNYPKAHIEVLQGAVLMAEESFYAGQKAPLGTQGLVLGNINLMLDGMELETTPEQTDKAATPGEQDQSPMLAESSLNMPDDLLQKKPYKFALVACSALLVAVGAWQTVQSRSPAAPDSATIVGAYLEQNQLNEVDVVGEENNITLTGRVERHDQLLDMEQFLSKYISTKPGATINTDVFVENTLVTQVEDYFRVNGVSTIISFDDDGVMQVKTATDEQKIESLKLAVARELPQLKNWEIENTAPVQPSSVKPDAGKRVAMVISDDPAYIVTEDSTRYFIGSVLPTGHRVIRIADGRVSLSKQGVQSELQF